MDEKANFLQNQVMPGVGDDTPLQFNFNLSVPPSMVNKPGLWQQLLLQLRDVYPVDLDADLGKVLVVQPVLGQSAEDCTQFLFNWIHVVNEIEAGEGIDVDSSDPRKPVISVLISDNPGNNITIGSDDGIFTPTYDAGSSLETDEVDGVITFNVVISGDLNNAIRLGTDGNVFAPQITINGITQDEDGNITIGPEDIGEYGVVPFGPGGNIPVDPADIGDHGVPPLDANGKIPPEFINEALLGAVTYKGVWEASTNTPTLPTAGVENKGWYFVATDAGVLPGTSTAVRLGDWVISDGTQWGLVNALDGVTSVNGKVGIVTITKSDLGLDNVDNTSDADKPISTAQATALAGKLNKAGDQMSGGLSWANVTGSTPQDLTKHINLYGGTYGFAVTGNTLNYNAALVHDFYAGTSLIARINSSGITATGNITAYSDARYKNFQGKLESSWNKLKDINSYYYTWNERATFATEETRKKTYLGVSAQEVQAQFPELVLESEEGILSVDYGRLSVVLLDVVKELQARVEALEAKS